MDLFDYAQAKGSTEKEPLSEPIYTVGELTTEIKSILEGRFGRERIWVKGEISNFRGRNQTGHMYFNLRDQDSVLGCAFFRNANRSLAFDLKDGLEVLVAGRISVYPPRGNYQLIVEEIRPGGTGELYLRFELLKKKLEEEGLFAPDRKRPLPPFPKRIGMVTSPTGAVVRDIIHVVRHRCPFVTLLLFPVKVQGEGAAEEISKAIRELNHTQHELDLLIVGRGGGSIEDLWAFNEEIVARAIADSKLPVVSAVGHQTDFTIADFVADLRAATPSQAAELAVPDMMELKQRLETLVRTAARELEHKTKRAGEQLHGLKRSPLLRDPRTLIRNREQRLSLAVERMAGRISVKREREAERVGNSRKQLGFLASRLVPPLRLRFEKIAGHLGALDPLAVLGRGYSVVNTKMGTIVKRSSQVAVGDDVSVRLHEGRLQCEVNKTFDK